MSGADLINTFFVAAFGLAALYAVLKYGSNVASILNAFGQGTATAIQAAKA